MTTTAHRIALALAATLAASAAHKPVEAASLPALGAVGDIASASHQEVRTDRPARLHRIGGYEKRWHRRHWRPRHRHHGPSVYFYYNPPPVYRYYAPRPVYRYRVERYERDDGDAGLAGGVIGAVLGAVVGNQFGKGRGRTVATVGGAVLGAVVGSHIGRSMARSDHERVVYVLESSRTGRAVEWRNPDTGNDYTVTPIRTYRNGEGQDCREYTVWGWIGGFEEQLHGHACRMADGQWRNVS